MKGLLLWMPEGTAMDEMKAMLSADYEVRCFSRYGDALRAMAGEGQDIAAVLADLELAQENGFAFAEQAARHISFSEIPVLGIRRGPLRDGDAACLDHGFFDVISLPCPKALLLRKIQNSIRATDSLTFHEVEKMLKALPSNIFLKDTQGRYVFATQYWHHLNMTDDPDWTIRGKTDMEIRKDKGNARKAMEADREILRTGKGTDYIIKEKADGADEFLELIKRPVYDKNGNISGIIALINNVTEQQLLKMELEKRSRIDPLTELLNKRTTEEHIRMMLEASMKDHEQGAMLMIDVDDFKTINDCYGHAAGDRVLAEIGRIIRSHFRVMDVTGRIGGDEFMVFLRDISGADAVRHSADRIQEQARAAFPEIEQGVSLSIGIALHPQHGASFEALYKAADTALYQVKKHGKAASWIYDPACGA